MNQNSERVPLDDILNAYAISDQGPSYATLTEWIHRYPSYERELTEFTANWALLSWLPTPASNRGVDEDVLTLRGMAIVQNILQEQTRTARERSLLKGILQEGAQLGLSIQRLAERAQMSLVLLRKLDLRLIQFSTIPHQAIESLAHAIGCESSVVANYLQGTPILPRGANYRAEQPPALGEPENFFAAVSRDMSMPPELRKFWLSFAPTDAC